MTKLAAINILVNRAMGPSSSSTGKLKAGYDMQANGIPCERTSVQILFASLSTSVTG